MKIPLTQVSIIAEGVLRDHIVELVHKHGATGHTITQVEGEGSSHRHASDWGGRNIKVETLVSQEVADAIIENLSHEFFEDYSVIAWLTQVNVLRGSKFLKR
ncbi:MAG: transcriptional regulator [Puniceicoccaceae bacterium]|nr:MAG: transcriptional regulator [Puniceicoccaceae bacterium]